MQFNFSNLETLFPLKNMVTPYLQKAPCRQLRPHQFSKGVQEGQENIAHPIFRHQTTLNPGEPAQQGFGKVAGEVTSSGLPLPRTSQQQLPQHRRSPATDQRHFCRSAHTSGTRTGDAGLICAIHDPEGPGWLRGPERRTRGWRNGYDTGQVEKLGCRPEEEADASESG